MSDDVSGTRKRRRILLLTDTFAPLGGRPWLVDDLVVELAAEADVDVVVMDLNAPRRRGREQERVGGVRVWSVGPQKPVSGVLRRITAYALCWVRLHSEVAPRLTRGSYDLAVFTSPGIVTGGLPARLRRRGIAERLMFVLWDFFPVHHAQIGRVPGGAVEAALKRAERATIEACDVVAVMSPNNEHFLREYHVELAARTVLLAPWSADSPSDEPPTKRERFTVVFGGQLTRGRGVETLIDAAQILQDKGVPVTIEVYGWGPHRDELVSRAKTAEVTLLTFHEPLPRDHYRRMLRSVHAGVAVTVPDVSVPTFPSKIVDYGQASIAVIACLEAASDVSTLLELEQAGVTCQAGDAVALAGVIEDLVRAELADGRATQLGRNARRLYETRLSAEAAARTVLSVAEGTAGRVETSKGWDL